MWVSNSDYDAAKFQVIWLFVFDTLFWLADWFWLILTDSDCAFNVEVVVHNYSFLLDLQATIGKKLI